MSLWDKAARFFRPGEAAPAGSLPGSGPDVSGQKADWMLSDGRPGFHDRDNFVTNRVTLADYDDAGTDNRLAHAATWSCVNLIAGTIGSLSVDVCQNIDGRQVVMPSHPLQWLLHNSPNFDDTALEFWEFLAASVELHGNGYAPIRRGSMGQIVAIDRVAPDRMRVTRNAAGGIEYRWADNGRSMFATEAEMVHVRGPFGNGLTGLSPLSVCRRVFSGARDADQAAGKMFANGAMPSGVLSMDETLNGEQRTYVEDVLAQKFAGAMNAGRPMVLDRGMKWNQLSITPEDAQMLDSRKFSGEEICRLFQVPPAMVGYGDKASNWGTGKEVDVLGFQKFVLRRRAKRIEQALIKQLLSPAEQRAGLTIRFNMESLLRGDSDGRAKFYAQGLTYAWMTINEVRALEGLAPVAGGDVPRMQMQMVPLDSDPAAAREIST